MRSVFFSFSSEIIETVTVSGAMPTCITANIPTKKCSGISSRCMAFSIIAAIIGNITN
jgi:hypothetical protein